mmetsp:Transcript_41708/g.100421  ORF Transcript_41708/g.100421 Transcript_41708/m.100421 type:complete len:263 (-) Transcript_41708:3495-4283(-)
MRRIQIPRVNGRSILKLTSKEMMILQKVEIVDGSHLDDMMACQRYTRVRLDGTTMFHARKYLHLIVIAVESGEREEVTSHNEESPRCLIPMIAGTILFQRRRHKTLFRMMLDIVLDAIDTIEASVEAVGVKIAVDTVLAAEVEVEMAEAKQAATRAANDTETGVEAVAPQNGEPSRRVLASAVKSLNLLNPLKNRLVLTKVKGWKCTLTTLQNGSKKNFVRLVNNHLTQSLLRKKRLKTQLTLPSRRWTQRSSKVSLRVPLF